MKRVAVIGGGLGGLQAAGVLAREGHAVTLFEATASLGGKAQVVQRDGFTFDTGPTLLTMPETVRESFAVLGALDLLPRFLRLPLQTHYRFADGRELHCWEDLERTAQSAEAFGAGEGAALHRFYAEAAIIYAAAGAPYLEAPFTGFPGFMRRALRQGLGTLATGLKLDTLDGLARRHFQSEALRSFVGRFATYAGASPYAASAAFAMIPHLEHAFGTHHVEGGMGALVKALVKAVTRQGVLVVTQAKARWQRVGRELVVGPQGSEAPFDAVVVNADPLAQLGRSDEPLALSGYVFFLQTDAKVDLAHHEILFSRDYRQEFEQLFSGQVPTDPTLYVCHPAATDASMAPEGRSGLYVMVNAPALVGDAASAWPQHAARLREHCVRRLRESFSSLASARLSFAGERTPVDLAAQGAPGGSIYGFLPHGRFGPFRRPAVRSQVPGVFYAGGGTHPGGGVPLVLLSGRHAATLVGEAFGAGRRQEARP